MGLGKYFNKKEVATLLGAAIILGFVISFRQWGYQEFSFGIGMANWIRAFILSFIVFAVYLVATNNVAKLHGAKTTFKLWGIERYWFSKDSRFIRMNFFGLRFKEFKIGVFLPIIVSLVSNGIVKLATIAYTEITEIMPQRAGKKYPHLTDFEVARIHLAGPMAT